ncbi:adenosylcobalamin-dependent ribonucleoside-diphosphate reductase, partial [Enterococcus faecium]|nr:adenosylcobalamin-dependent ribonucleoside-diphosphate reductase [Enterococcus faecium]
AIVHGVNGKSSGSVSWLNDLANLTNLVEQGGSRRGAQMIMLNDWHPDIFEFIISKIQNPAILQNLIHTSQSPIVRQLASEKLTFEPLIANEKEWLEYLVDHPTNDMEDKFLKTAQQKLKAGGTYSVKDPDFLTGANISVCLTKEFMEAVETDQTYELRFPAIEDYDASEMADYDQHWMEIGDVREWAETGRKVKIHQTIKARELWDLITYCATYSAEPGIFFIDNANEMTNAQAYGQKVVATNPCGEQPLTPYAVCNLAAINLANMVDKETKVVDFEKLADVVRASVRFQDNVIDATPYFFEKNEQQAKGERRVGLGVMGLADLLIYCEKVYGSEDGNRLVDQVFEKIAVTAYQTSVELAKEKGSFPFLVGKTVEETTALRQRFIESGYMKKMPESIRQAILKYGIRNSHLLTVAPTGSTGTMAGVSTGLEPYFSFSY